MSRNIRAQIAEQTVEIAARGWYELPSGQRVDITSAMRQGLDGTRLYTPEMLDNLLQQLPAAAQGITTKFEVANETTLAAARQLVQDRGLATTLCLNFASAKNPGGGFLGGSQAQEESLARSSGLYASLTSQYGYYDVNRRCGTALYTDHMILSPGVAVFRDDSGALLDAHYLVSFVTAPAVNAGAIRKNEPARAAEIVPTMETRTAKLLALAAHAGYEHLVLGAWGCGVFRNDPHQIAELFAQLLLSESAPYCNRFQTIVFAVLDAADERVIAPFRRHFGNGASP